MAAAINKAELGRLFADPAANRDAIRLELFAIASLAAGRLARNPADREDLAQGIWLKLDRSIDKFKPSRGNPFSYFWKIAVRHGWRLCSRNGRPCEELLDVGGGRLPRDCQSLAARTPAPFDSAITLLDRYLRHAAQEARNLNPETPGYVHLKGGVDYLQQLRRDLAGEYFTMAMPDLRYRRTRKLVNDQLELDYALASQEPRRARA